MLISQFLDWFYNFQVVFFTFISFQVSKLVFSISRSSSLPLFLFRFPSWFFHFQVVFFNYVSFNVSNLVVFQVVFQVVFFTFISFQVSKLVLPFLGRLLYLYFFSGFRAGFSISRSSSLPLFLFRFQSWFYHLQVVFFNYVSFNVSNLVVFQVVFFTYNSYYVSKLVLTFLGRLLYLFFFSGFQAGFTISRSSSLPIFLCQVTLCGALKHIASFICKLANFF